MLTQTKLKEILHYNPDTGIFTWLIAPSRSTTIGDIAGTYLKDGGIQICIAGKLYKAHRLAFLYMDGIFPVDYIDHKDTIRSHNWWSNLRKATFSNNMHNVTLRKDNTSGVKGVTWCKTYSKWLARVRLNGKYKHVGYFDDLNKAEIAIRRVREELHGEFANHG